MADQTETIKEIRADLRETFELLMIFVLRAETLRAILTESGKLDATAYAERVAEAQSGWEQRLSQGLKTRQKDNQDREKERLLTLLMKYDGEVN
jgi:hypothetical protein